MDSSFRFAWIFVAVVTVAGLAALLIWPGGPVAIHFNIHGEADGYARPAIGFMVLPVVMALAAAISEFTMVRVTSKSDVARSRKSIVASLYGTMTLLVLVQFIIIATAFGHELPIVTYIAVAIGLLFVVLGNYMPKSRPNPLFGIRTPWTLASEQAWIKTHRFSGPLWIAGGTMIVAAAWFLPAPLTLIALLIVTTILVVICTGYSYLTWRAERST